MCLSALSRLTTRAILHLAPGRGNSETSTESAQMLRASGDRRDECRSGGS